MNLNKAACLMILCLATAPATAGEKPNVLFIAVDDLRPELGCFAAPVVKTPNIDRLAKSGMVFNRAYCQQAVCSPSRSSLLTGARPDTTRVWDLSTHFRKAMPDVVTLPQFFKVNGYVTQSIGKIFHHGIDDTASWSVPSTFPKAPHGAERAPVDPSAEAGASKRGPAFRATAGDDNSLHDGELADMAVAALPLLKKSPSRFFLAVGFIRPHLPFISPQKYWDLYDPQAIPLAPNPFPSHGAPSYAIVPGGELRSYGGVPVGRQLPDDYARQLKHGYLAAVSYVDAQIGRVIDALEREGLRENTIIVLWGDHGWKLGEHGAWAKHSNVENDTRVPLLICAPGMASNGKRSDALVELVDVYPTLADLAGLPLPNHLEGTSLKPLLEGRQIEWKSAAFSQYPRKVGKQNLMGYSMRTDRYRLTRWVNRDDHTKVASVELYDHSKDPLENENIAEDPTSEEILTTLTAQWTAGWRGAAPKAVLPPKTR